MPSARALLMRSPLASSVTVSPPALRPGGRRGGRNIKPRTLWQRAKRVEGGRGERSRAAGTSLWKAQQLGMRTSPGAAWRQTICGPRRHWQHDVRLIRRHTRPENGCCSHSAVQSVQSVRHVRC